jgi:outer membrane protein TolC
MTEADQVKIINKLMLDAAKDYWQWYYAYYNYRLLQRGVKIAEEIFRRVNINHQYGEAATIDTVQAKITLQERLIEQQEALLDFQNSGIRVSTFLWDSLSRPLSLDLTWVPVLEPGTKALPSSVLIELIDQARTNHPDLQKLGIKLRQLEVERRLAAEYLKPRLDLNYYFLNQPLDPEGGASLQFGDNYKLGLDFSFPIFLRKERAKLALTKLKLSNTNFERNLAERQIVNELNSAYNQLMNIQSIMQAQRDLVQSYERLLDAELLNLQEGESDLFKINLQQEKLIQTQTKWLKLVAENEKQKAYLYWAAGVRNLGGLN